VPLVPSQIPPHIATKAPQDGIDIRTLQQWMGHRDIASTMVYLKGVRIATYRPDQQGKPGSIRVVVSILTRGARLYVADRERIRLTSLRKPALSVEAEKSKAN